MLCYSQEESVNHRRGADTNKAQYQVGIPGIFQEFSNVTVINIYVKYNPTVCLLHVSRCIDSPSRETGTCGSCPYRKVATAADDLQAARVPPTKHTPLHTVRIKQIARLDDRFDSPQRFPSYTTTMLPQRPTHDQVSRQHRFLKSQAG